MATYPDFNVISLCAGIAGIDLGLRLAVPASRTICYVENEVANAKILATRFADGTLDDAPIWTDLRTFDGEPWRNRVHCIVAGYPCQPFSVAGRKQGRRDKRHLWPHVARIVREVTPDLVFIENVSNHFRLGFPEVRRELRSMGYTVAAGEWSAAEVGRASTQAALRAWRAGGRHVFLQTISMARFHRLGDLASRIRWCCGPRLG